ncbi:MAG: heme exporter protein CcmD [Coriobacteriales bacterium]|jgi:CcmD family protein|nr:heme exporter protein CcmD [Coriobacteriales bacterium]
MDPIQAEIYSTVLTAAPYVIAAYALMWLVLLVYILFVSRSLKKTEQQLAALEEAMGQGENGENGENRP